MARRPQRVACQSYPILPPWAHNQVALRAEHPCPSQDSEHYLVTFYNKLSAAMGLLFLHLDKHGALTLYMQVVFYYKHACKYLLEVCHNSLSYFTGTFLLFSNSNDGSTDNSLPAALRKALVHLVFLGLRFFLKALWHFDLQNRNICK